MAFINSEDGQEQNPPQQNFNHAQNAQNVPQYQQPTYQQPPNQGQKVQNIPQQQQVALQQQPTSAPQQK